MGSTALNSLIAMWDLDSTKVPLGNHPAHDPEAEKLKPKSFQSILEGMEYAEKEWLGSYLPTQSGPHPSEFFDRLLLWVNNISVSDEDAAVLFEFASQILFFSAEDFHALYRNAYTGTITRWVANQIPLKIDNPNWSDGLTQERANRTWYCPVTDSMVIASFYHINHLAGVSHRPEFRYLFNSGQDGSTERKYMQTARLNRLVLLEDFVGSGSQTSDTIKWAVEKLGKPVLFVPLIIAPDGHRRLKELETEVGRDLLQVSPVIVLEPSDFVGPATEESAPLFTSIRTIAERLHASVKGEAPYDPKKAPYGPLGFRRPRDTCSGGTIVNYSNCPNNTIPLVHHHGPDTQWKALFPRVEREPNSL